jgi:hypothetical protein
MENRKIPTITRTKTKSTIIRNSKEMIEQEIKVRRWRDSHKRFAIAMLRNFILLLDYKIPNGEKMQKIYRRRLIGQKEIDKKKNNINLSKALGIIWKAIKNMLKWALENQISAKAKNNRRWIQWTKGIDELIYRLIKRTMNKLRREIRDEYRLEVAAVKALKLRVKPLLQT